MGNRWAYAARAGGTERPGSSAVLRSHIGMAGLAFLIGAAGIVLAAMVAESSMTAEQHIMLFEQSSFAP